MHANDLDVRPHGFDVVGYAGDEAAAANGDKHCIQVGAAQFLQLLQHFHCHRALAGDDIGVVKGVDKGQPLLFL